MKDKTTAGLLALFLGGFGVHKFYLNKPILGIIYLVFCWTYVPAIIAFVEALMFFFQDQDDFDEKYNAEYVEKDVTPVIMIDHQGNIDNKLKTTKALGEYKRLLDDEVITREEFAKAKKNIIGNL